MKTIVWCAIAVLLLTPSKASCTQNAQIRMYSISFRLNGGTDEYLDFLTMNSTDLPDGAGELYPSFDYIPQGSELTLLNPDASYTSGLSIYDSLTCETYAGAIELPVPGMVDTNHNGYPDFFEVALPLNQTTTMGGYSLGAMGSGVITAVWTRPAGSRMGTCKLTPSQPYWGTFKTTFEIFEYTGTLSYTPGSNTVPAGVTLTQTCESANTLQGFIPFIKAKTNKTNMLTNQPAVWLSPDGQAFTCTNHLFTRLTGWPTNYAGYIEFDDDGTQATFFPYARWVLSITDTNDANHNGIPDFSDAPQGTQTQPRRPKLALARGASDLKLTIRGDTNRLCVVQATPSLTSANWQPVTWLNLATDPQTISLPLPTGTRYWRVLAP